MSQAKKFVICIHNGEYAGTLEVRKVYEVLDDEFVAKRNYIRVIDESGEDYLYPGSWFVSVDVPEEIEQLLHELAVK